MMIKSAHSVEVMLELEKQLAVWNATEQPYPHDASVPTLIARQAASTPDAVALVADGQTVSYRNLNRRANQLAHYLQTLGVGPNVLVGVCLERSVDLVVALLGILKAGGAYVPMDPIYPSDRLAFMVKDAQAPVLVTTQRLSTSFPLYNTKAVCLDAPETDVSDRKSVV